jgi:hypothetical protein
VLAGAGYLPAAAIAAALILTTHLALRPVAQRVDRLPAAPGSEIQTTYSFRAVTRAADEAHIRTLLVRELTRDDFVLRSVQSHDLNGGSGLVEVTAELQSQAAATWPSKLPSAASASNQASAPSPGTRPDQTPSPPLTSSRRSRRNDTTGCFAHRRSEITPVCDDDSPDRWRGWP